MNNKLQQTIKDELSQLPKEAQDAISTLDWLKIAEEIGKKFLLEEDEVEDFQLETLLVLIGVVDPEFYAINIENQVETTKDTAEKIAEEVFEKIFTPISNIAEENIKKNLLNKNPNHEQNINFVLSGGDYSAFLPPSPLTPLHPPYQGEQFASPDKGRSGGVGEGRGEAHPTPPTLAEIKSQFKV